MWKRSLRPDTFPPFPQLSLPDNFRCDSPQSGEPPRVRRNGVKSELIRNGAYPPNRHAGPQSRDATRCSIEKILYEQRAAH
ncbi:hypothetical protein AVEN_124529-1 [Araneus ventricosus]|uniref:Uncharacterized protein n=1 Tax=Araneus ventricosus TaxID=182803 RepID=A0A4Y2TRC6_ARAVE|nr:hypothetical protein AVEN_46410-1 [Araneus ventricosus]GBO03416.1 hypothetical protein AVEN_47905-1 [Araneus ventricosus]GBO03449.1 hypothetical protein AVEN_124529-1 [Araneus ventricosus]